MISTFIKSQLKGTVLAGALLAGSSMYAQLGLTWSEMGPNDIAGRCRSIVVDRTDGSGNKMFAAGVSGGVFKTTDAGANWSPVNDQSASLIVSSMTQDNSGNLFFGTGETFGRGGDGAGSSGFAGTGLYKITVNTTSVSLVKDSAFFGNINEIAIDGANVIYVAAQKGFFYSTDGGTNFTQVSSNSAMDVKVAKNDDVYYSAGVKTGSTSTVYYKASGSTTYTDITPTIITNRGRIEIAPSPADANYVYLSIAKQKTTSSVTGGLSAVLVSKTKGANWSVITIGTAQFDPFLNSAGNGFGDYSNTIVGDPSKADACFLGSEVFYSWSQIAGYSLGQGTWTQIGFNINIPLAFYIHSKVHDVKFNGGNNSMYIATDGGIYKSVAGNSGFLAYNKGFNISQFNSVSFPINPKVTGTSTYQPVTGVAGGSIGNNLTYLPGNFQNGLQTSTSFGSTDAFQSDFSRIIPKAAFYSGAYGTIYRVNDIETATFGTFYDNSYKGGGPNSPGSSGTTSNTMPFANENTPMRLWENYNSIDSLYYLNEPLKTIIQNNNPTKTKFSAYLIKGQKDQRYQMLNITTTSTKLFGAPANQTITIYPQYNGPTSISSYSVIGSLSTYNYIKLSQTSSFPNDSIFFEFDTAPNDSSKITITADLIFKTQDTITSLIGNNNSATAKSFKLVLPRSKAKYRYQNLQISTVSTKSVAAPTSQTINIAIGSYNANGDSIPMASQTVTGSANLASAFNNYLAISNKLFSDSITYSPLKVKYFNDTIRLNFTTAPDSCKFNVVASFITNDSIIVRNTDISGNNFNTGKPLTGYLSTTVTPVQLFKFHLRNSARLAVGVSAKSTSEYPSVFVVKRPLNFAINPDWVKVSGKNSRMDSVSNTMSSYLRWPVLGTTVTRLEWANNGQNIYFSTKGNNDTTYYLYRISHLEFIGDSSDADYGGIFTSDVDSATTYRKKPAQRTTPLGKFKYPITSIALSADDKTLLVTCGGYKNKTATVYTSNSDVATLSYNWTDASNFSPKNGTGLPLIPAYSSLLEMTDSKRALVGTENGIYSTTDITQPSPTWVLENTGGFPNVPVFQIRQQTYPSYKCYNSGVIYAATHGRGIWWTDKYLTKYAIGIDEKEKTNLSFESNIRLFPNPTSDATNIWFNAAGEAAYKVRVYDISGRTLFEHTTAKLQEGEQVISFNTSSLNSGVYFVSVNGTNNFNATTKLVISR